MLRLVQTGWGCPEQYDAYLSRQLVGYIRHRHGTTESHCPLGKVVWDDDSSIGDGLFDDEERDRFLTACCMAILLELGFRRIILDSVASGKPLYEVVSQQQVDGEV
jgi:hypothetical protein